MNSLNEISKTFNKGANDARKLVSKVFGTERSTNTSIDPNGIRIHILFRNEEDYNILVPWKVIDQGEDAIEQYFEKFYRCTKHLSTVNAIAVFADDFNEKQATRYS
ncbi:MAG: hypothetical protein ACOC5T_04995 [Elusimicrobiota bacterium]